MKILTKEEEAAHYRATVQGGILGGVAGLAVGAVGVYAASRRYHFFRQLTLPLKAFLVTSSGTFAGIIAADHSSRGFEMEQNPIALEYRQREQSLQEAENAGKTFTQRAMEFGRKERYKIVGASWIASMFTAFAIVNRNKYLTGPQKLVQARVYAQFLTLGVLVASAAFEISDQRNSEGRFETVRYVDPKDPEHKRMLEKQVERDGVGHDSQSDGDSLWKDMVAAEEERMKQREEEEKRIKAAHHKKRKSQKNGNGEHKEEEKKETKKEDKEEK